MPEPRLDIELPPATTTVHLSGQAPIQADLEVDQQIVLIVRATVRKAGLTSTDDGPRPFATCHADTIRLLTDGDTTAAFTGITAEVVSPAVADDERRRAREARR